MYVFVKQSGY